MRHKNVISEYYSARCAEHGQEGWAAGLYATPDNQYGTFVNLLKTVERGGSILDVGCGQGDLWEFIDSRGLGLSYLGIDLCPAMIGYAKARFPEGDFAVCDVLDYHEDHDFVVAAGALNLAVPGQEDYARQVIRKLYSLARRAASFNLLSDAYRDYERRPELCFYDPAETVRLCLELTPYLYVDHRSSGYDFCVYLLRP
jgi:SAM-dependent methyltransferase